VTLRLRQRATASHPILLLSARAPCAWATGKDYPTETELNEGPERRAAKDYDELSAVNDDGGAFVDRRAPTVSPTASAQASLIAMLTVEGKGKGRPRRSGAIWLRDRKADGGQREEAE
jgi:hypothetical protein